MIPMANKKDFLSGKLLVPETQMRIIWGNLETLAPINEALLLALQSELVTKETGDYKQAQIGEIFIKFSSYLKLYSTYCENQPYALSALAELRNDSQFEAFLAERADACVVEEVRNLDIGAFLIKPVQRICKYPLFLRVCVMATLKRVVAFSHLDFFCVLKELLRNTPAEHPSHAVVENAANELDRVVLSINENKKRRENNIALSVLITRLYNLGASIFWFGSRLKACPNPRM
jgi:hypothetical protein